MRPPRIEGFDYLGLYRYSLCFVAKDRAHLFVSATIVAAALRETRRTFDQEAFALLAYCFMPDHVHLIVEGLRDDADLQRAASLAKQRIAYVYRTQFAIPLTWQSGYFERVLRSDEATNVVVRYVLDNPVRARLVLKAEDYPFSGAMYWPEG